MNKAQEQAVAEQRALIEMYKAGFKDAVGRWGPKTKDKALECFKRRFESKKTNKLIKRLRKRQKRLR